MDNGIPNDLRTYVYNSVIHRLNERNIINDDEIESYTYLLANSITVDGLWINVRKVITELGYEEDELQKIQNEVSEKCREQSKPTVQITGLKLDNYIDNVEAFHHHQPFFYDDAGLFWFWDKQKLKWIIVDDIDLFNSLDDSLGFCGQTVAQHAKNNYMEAFKRVGRKHKPVNSPTNWIQFNNQIYDIKEDKIFDAHHKYFFTNPIPFNIGDSDSTPVMDKIFNEWVGDKYVKTLYQIIAYCCYSDYPLHRIFALVGTGLNGKSKYLDLLRKFVGVENITSTELDTLLNSRFEITRLFKKLVCVMGETNFSLMKKTSILKKLTGQDIIGFEYKNKNPFTDYNYAKILIATNTLPLTEDKSRGFYRRWLVISFPNEFTEKKDILNDIPEVEYNNLARKCINLIKELLKNREFHNEGTIEQRQKKYEDTSNILQKFIKTRCSYGVEYEITFTEFFSNFTKFCKENKHRELTAQMVGRMLSNEGYERITRSVRNNDETTSKKLILGLKIKEEIQGTL